MREKRDAEELPAWFQQVHPRAPFSAVAYFSMEFMLSEALPIYSGGLGNVAGDQLKTASNLGVPVVGIGLLYQQGYFRQEFDARGQQQALYPFNDPGQLPIRPLREANGEWLRFSIPFPGTALWIRAWQVQIGRVRLYLLDTNDPAGIGARGRSAPARRESTAPCLGTESRTASRSRSLRSGRMLAWIVERIQRLLLPARVELLPEIAPLLVEQPDADDGDAQTARRC